MLGVRLGKHHQLDVVGVSPAGEKLLQQIGDLVIVERQAHVAVGLLEARAPLGEQVDGLQRARRRVIEQCMNLLDIREQHLGHAIVDAWAEGGLHERVGVAAGVHLYLPLDAALHAIDLAQAAVVQDVRGFTGPGGNRARPGYDQKSVIS